jgi:ABC-type nickel/cobalt efflux system permease component RcnA
VLPPLSARGTACVFCMSIGTFMREVWSVTYGI